MPLVTAPLQVEVLAEPDNLDYETDWVPGTYGMTVRISGFRDGTLVYGVRLWDSSPKPVLLGEIQVQRILGEGDLLQLAGLSLN